jgi:hypothetical protein
MDLIAIRSAMIFRRIPLNLGARLFAFNDNCINAQKLRCRSFIDETSEIISQKKT